MVPTKTLQKCITTGHVGVVVFLHLSNIAQNQHYPAAENKEPHFKKIWKSTTVDKQYARTVKHDMLKKLVLVGLVIMSTHSVEKDSSLATSR